MQTDRGTHGCTGHLSSVRQHKPGSESLPISTLDLNQPCLFKKRQHAELSPAGDTERLEIPGRDRNEAVSPNERIERQGGDRLVQTIDSLPDRHHPPQRARHPAIPEITNSAGGISGLPLRLFPERMIVWVARQKRVVHVGFAFAHHAAPCSNLANRPVTVFHIASPRS